jgi:SAM-dependent methyltransferase
MTPAQNASLVERVVLHVGCGTASSAKLPDAFFPVAEWRELRLDIDPGVAPDVVASITDMATVKSGSVDAVWSSHNVEHLYPHEVSIAFAEFRRVLKPGGFALITLPDLQQIAELIAADKLDQVAYHSPSGPITPLDMLYGHNVALAQGNSFMGHRTGFTAHTLEVGLTTAGFPIVRVLRDGKFGLWAAAYMGAASQA